MSDDTKTPVGLLICNFEKWWRHMKRKNSAYVTQRSLRYNVLWHPRKATEMTRLCPSVCDKQSSLEKLFLWNVITKSESLNFYLPSFCAGLSHSLSHCLLTMVSDKNYQHSIVSNSCFINNSTIFKISLASIVANLVTRQSQWKAPVWKIPLLSSY